MNIITNINQASNVLKQNNIELISFTHNVSYSTSLSQMYFDDFKSECENLSLWLGDHNGTDYLVFFANEEIKNAPYYKKSHLHKMNKQALYDLCEQYEILNYHHSNYYFEDNTKQMLIDELMKYITNEKYYTHHYNESSYHNLEYDFSITGYSQGDKVLIKLVGDKKQFIDNMYFPTKSYLTNVFYDCPLDVNITINVNGDESETIYLYCGEYEYYDKDKIIDMINSEYKDHKYYSQLLEYALNELPDDAEYAY